MKLAKVSLVGVIFLLVVRSVEAQSAPCTAPPQAPENVTATVAPATPGPMPGGPPSTPAVLKLGWTASRVGPAPTENAPTVYLIEAGTARGRSNVALVETEGTEMTYSTPLSNGTFYVRIKARNACGTSPASPEATVRVTDSVATGAPNPLVLMETVRTVRDRFRGTDYLRVMGQVRNGWRAAPASFIEVTATFEGSTGRAVGTKSTYVNGSSRRLKLSRLVTDTVLEPTAAGCFVVFADFPPAQVASVGLTVTSSPAFETEPLRGRVQSEGVFLQQADAFGDLLVSGRIRNIGDRPTSFNEIWMEAKDADGKVLDCDASYVNGSLNPAEFGVVENPTEAVFGLVNRLRHWINWDERDERRQPRPSARYGELKERLATMLRADEQASSSQERAALRDALRREVQSLEQRLTSP